jgi:hypothetical protein
MKTCWETAAAFLLFAGFCVASEPATQVSPVENPTPSICPVPPPVVPSEKLIAFLPEPPNGWTAEKPSGSINDIEVFKLSTASRTYLKGEEDNSPVTTITLIDAGGHQGYFDITTKSWQTNSQTPEGYDKKVEINGLSGFEHYDKASNTSSLSVVIAKRYFVQIEVTNQEPAQLREWLNKIDLKKLAELK